MKPGDIVADRFLIERLAGSGGMGSVYRALDRHTGEVAALKVMSGRGLEHGERFAREAQVLAGLRHPGIVRYIAQGATESGEPWLALEWLEGESLGDRLRRRGLTVAESIMLGLRIAEALAEAHRHGVVHRDLKPSNLYLIDKSVERVKLLDFGIARLAALAPLTMTGVVMGTPFYMAPEQARGERAVGPPADVFALGCVLFHCLTGRPPFVGDDIHTALLRVVLDEAPRLRDLRADVPEGVDAAVARMLAKDPAARPADGGAAADELLQVGEIKSTPPAPISRRGGALTTGERRTVCLMLARVGAKDAAWQGPTMPMTLPMTMPLARAAIPEAELTRVAARFGGALQTLADGLLLITLECRGLITDQAARAARCAIEVRDLIPGVQMALVAGRGTADDQLPMGPTIDRAVRLLDRAAGGAIRLDEVMAGLLDARFDVGGDATGLVLRGERDLSEAARTLLGRPTPFVGRDHEIAILDAVLDECTSEPTARAVLVTAPAGLGKSRLRYEFLRRVEERHGRVQVWLGHADPMSAGSPFGLLRQMLRREAGLSGGEPQELREQRLRARVGRTLSGGDLARVTEFLGEVARIHFSDEGRVELRAARADPMLMGDQIRRAFEDFVLAECRAEPVLLVLEDLHWGDLPTVKLIDAALAHRDQPLMVLALARPEIESIFPKLWASRGAQEIRLREIGRKGSERLVREVLGDAVPPELCARLCERAGGNAFYLEELIRAAASGRTEALPETVLSMVQARLESLDVEARRVLRAGSVFGQKFWRGGVAALLGGEKRAHRVGEWLSVLVDRELIARRGEGKFTGEEEYTFRHALVREAAYATLTDADRALGHLLAGEWLERVGERDAALLAEHFERGGDAERAVIWFRRAAEQALGANDFRAAIQRAEQGVASAERDGELFAALRLVQAEAHKWLGEAADAERCAVMAMHGFPRKSALWYAAAAEAASMRVRLGMGDRLADLVAELRGGGTSPGDAGGDRPPIYIDEATGPCVSALARIAGSLLHGGLYAAADEIVQELARVARPLAERDAAVAARIHALRASRALCYGEPAASLEWTEQSIPAYLQTGDLRNACLSRVNAAHCLVQLGVYGRAEAGLREALADAERMRLHNVAAFAKQNLGLLWMQQGDLAAARTVTAEAIEAFAAQANRRQEARARAYLAAILTRLGSLGAADAEAGAAVAMLAHVPTLQAFALAVRARVLLEQGRAHEALDVARRGLGLLVSVGGTEEGEAQIRLVYAESLRAAGHHGPAGEAIALAMQRLVARAQWIHDPAWRQSFCQAVPENAKTFALAALWQQEVEPTFQ
ncbi:protein kinase [Sorangium cellulosum]|uniref:Protein kinase n=1 Tax=Sorangium cellulosum TaxID=56 RepID=A0A2L0FBJ0_SORCE|nr:serine/threonine-protein kinase [Sorangium cellulosum]AUX48867.1 protein kinase [Sorangium cellulosum]